MNENRLPTHRPVTLRDVRPPSVYDYLTPEGRAAFDKARAAAVTNRTRRSFDQAMQRMDDITGALQELKKERRRRGR